MEVEIAMQLTMSILNLEIVMRLTYSLIVNFACRDRCSWCKSPVNRCNGSILLYYDVKLL